MKYISLIILSLIFLASCSTGKKVLEGDKQQSAIEKVELDEIDQRKFDYFFYEACREKMKGNLHKSAMYLSECLKIDPTSSASMYEMANLLLSNNEVDKAQGLLERAILIEPDNIWYNLLLAQLYQQNKLGTKAITIYENIVEKHPGNDEYLYGLAQIYQQNNRQDDAIKIYERLEKSLGLNEVIVLEKEQIYLDQEKNKLALLELKKLVESNPEEPRYYGYVADYYRYIKDFVNAKLYYQKVLKKDSYNSMAYFSLGNLAMSQQDTTTFVKYYKKALSQKSTSFEVKLQRILPLLMKKSGSINDFAYLEEFFIILTDIHPFEANAYIYLGNYYKAVKQSQKALKSYTQALSIQSNNELIWQEYILLLIDGNDYDLVYNKSLEAINLFPKNAFFYLIGASAVMQKPENEKALELLEKGYPLVGENKALKAQFLATMGDVYYALEQPSKAFAVYDESLKLDELNIVVLNNYSYYLTLENKNLDKAEKMSSKSVELEPGNATYLDTYAWVLFKRKRYFEAKYIIERALDNGGDLSYVIIEHYGDILFKNGDINKAVEQWKLSKSMGNESKILEEKIRTESYIEE